VKGRRLVHLHHDRMLAASARLAMSSANQWVRSAAR
jgi:hypothetical protein